MNMVPGGQPAGLWRLGPLETVCEQWLAVLVILVMRSVRTDLDHGDFAGASSCKPSSTATAEWNIAPIDPTFQHALLIQNSPFFDTAMKQIAAMLVLRAGKTIKTE